MLTVDVDASLGLVTCDCNPLCGVKQRDLLIPITGSAVGVHGSGVEQSDGNGSKSLRTRGM